MVVIRLKEGDENKIAKKLCNDDFEIYKNLKLVRLITSDLDEIFEKKVEYFVDDNTESYTDYNNTNDEYTIFRLQRLQKNTDRESSYQRHTKHKLTGRWKRR